MPWRYIDEEKILREVRNFWYGRDFVIMTYDPSFSAETVGSILEAQRRPLESMVAEYAPETPYEYIILDLARKEDVDRLYGYVEEHKSQFIRGKKAPTVFATYNVEAYLATGYLPELPLSSVSKYTRTLFVMAQEEFDRLRSLPSPTSWSPAYDVDCFVHRQPILRRLGDYISQE